MGGFEGGDEGGYWDVDIAPNPLYEKKKKDSHNETVYTQSNDSTYSIRAHAKVDVFFKVTGYENAKLTILSRSVRVEDVYATVSFVPAECDTFTVEGCENEVVENIQKVYTLLSDSPAGLDIVDFFCEHKVVIDSSTSNSLNLVTSASYAAAFMRLAKEVCNLILSTEELVKIGNPISIDFPFFIYNYPSANISGYGEVVELFEEEELSLELYAVEEKCKKTRIETIFEEHDWKNTSLSSCSSWKQLRSRSILELGLDVSTLNDSYTVLIALYPELKNAYVADSFFSGNSFFKIID